MPDRRKVPRYVFGETGRLHPSGQATGTNVIVRLISTLGCELEGAECPRVGKKCELYIDWRNAQIGVVGQVVWTDEEGAMGLEFLSVDEASQCRLNDLCAALRIQPPSAPAPEFTDASPYLPEPPAPPPRLALEELKRERRQVPRYISELPARVTNPVAGAASKVSLITLSILGVCIEGRGLPEPGQRCDLNTEWRGRPLHLAGDVVWKRADERAGVKFASLDQETEQLLRQVCSNLRLQPLAHQLPDSE